MANTVYVKLLGLNAAPYDAVTRSTLDFMKVLEGLGIKAKFYAKCLDSSLAHVVNDRESFWEELSESDIVFYHYSIDDPNLEKLVKIKNKKHVYYHGITPPEHIREMFSDLSKECQKGIDALGSLRVFDTLCANSWFNINQVLEHCEKEPSELFTLPPFLEMNYWDDVSSVKPDKLIEGPGRRLLYVGRRFPHKNIEDLLRMLSFLGEGYELVLVGTGAVDVYEKKIEDLSLELKVDGRVQLLNSVTNEELKYLFVNSSALVSMSKHEGFAVPIVEAMKHKLPVFVCNNGAMGEVLIDKGGILPQDPQQAAVHVNSSLENDAVNLLSVQGDIYRYCYSDDVVMSKYKEYIIKAILKD